jgi:hypothetical protein
MDSCFEQVEESRIMHLLDVTLVPQSGVTYQRPIGGAAEPACGGRIEGGATVVTQQSDGVALHGSANAEGTRVIIQFDPQERHDADVSCHRGFHGRFGLSEVPSVESERASRSGEVAPDSPGRARLDHASRLERLPNQQAEDGASVIAAARGPTAMLS